MISGDFFWTKHWREIAGLKDGYRSNGLFDSLWSDCHVSYADHVYIVNGKRRPRGAGAADEL